MTTIMHPEEERFPLAAPVTIGDGEAVRPFGLSVARWDANVRFERDKVGLDAETQTGVFGDVPLRELVGLNTTCQVDSDGQNAIVLDYPLDDGK